MRSSRRKFMLQTSAALIGTGIATSLPLDAFAESVRRVSANDKINFGLIGCKGMGWTDLRAQLTNVPESHCIALADVDQSVLDERATDVEALRGKRPKLFKDYRQLLEMKDLDAVIIGTPDH
ncbi:MAG: gfo/Idh/MocA family oxidoreductase, partial [Saprospiraceae bacterium]|nr:gfo/Idh/MocA family oxidoreductase [Saprospiraceae bacterium]